MKLILQNKLKSNHGYYDNSYASTNYISFGFMNTNYSQEGYYYFNNRIFSEFYYMFVRINDDEIYSHKYNKIHYKL